MSFTEWIFLLGGIAVIGPIVSHLLAKPRFKRLPFTMLRFLYQGQKESQSRRRLRDILILLLRCAIIILIAVLFARPRLHTNIQPSEAGVRYYLGLDDSMSMEYYDKTRKYIDKVIDAAKDFIRSADDDGIFSIYALASGRWVCDLTKQQSLAELRNLKAVPDSANIEAFFSSVNRARPRSGSNEKVSVFIASDFSPNIVEQFKNLVNPITAEDTEYAIISPDESINNAAIIEVHIGEVINGRARLNVTVINYGPIRQERQLRAKIGDRESIPLGISLQAYERKVCQIDVYAGATGNQDSYLPVELSLSKGDGLEEDDTYYLGVHFRSRQDLNVVLAGNKTSDIFLPATAMQILSKMDSSCRINLSQIPIDMLDTSDLNRADVVICASLTEKIGDKTAVIREFMQQGGRMIFFVENEISRQAATQLWNEGVLPALPGKLVHGPIYLCPEPDDTGFAGMDEVVAETLSNYGFDSILLKGYCQLTPHPKSRCIWRIKNDIGFIYCLKVGRGASLLINTSADDSLGTLTKSNASVPFLWFLLGRRNGNREYSFSRGTTVMLPVNELSTDSIEPGQLLVQTCDGRNRKAALTDSFLLIQEPAGIGWVKTLSQPVIYAGVNLPEGETDITPPSTGEVENIIEQTFLPMTQTITSAAITGNKAYKSIWKTIAWIIIVMLIAETAIANRLKR